MNCFCYKNETYIIKYITDEALQELKHIQTYQLVVSIGGQCGKTMFYPQIVRAWDQKLLLVNNQFVVKFVINQEEEINLELSIFRCQPCNIALILMDIMAKDNDRVMRENL